MLGYPPIMSTNPYKPPTANLDQVEPELTVPEDIAKKIKSGWIAGVVSISFTMAFILWSFYGTEIMGINAWGLIDVALMAGLTFGVYKKSRTCAVLLLAFFVLNKIIMWMDAGAPTGLIMALAFMWFFYQGVAGTFEYHHWKRDTQTV